MKHSILRGSSTSDGNELWLETLIEMRFQKEMIQFCSVVVLPSTEYSME